MQQGETIAAIATAPGAGGIGIIRISGEHAIAVASRVFHACSGRSLEEMESYRAAFGTVCRENGVAIDEAIALVMRAPHSYTCEDVVELQCHGSQVALREVLEAACQAGARLARRGEFTERAFLNGRLDLNQAQAVMDIVQAKTRQSLIVAESQLAGRLSGEIRAMQQELLAIIAHLEAGIDFPEEGVADVDFAMVAEKIAALRGEVHRLLATADAGRILRDGLETAIIGKPNVGKSSLLNALLGEERAIVTNVPGTTRDSIAEYANVGGVPLHIIDTAGIRETSDEVERIGVARARECVSRARLILALFDGSRPPDAEDAAIGALIKGRDAIVLVTKRDLAPAWEPSALFPDGTPFPILPISSKTGDGMSNLIAAIRQKACGASRMESEEAVFVSDVRTANLLREADAQLAAAQETQRAALGEDFLSIDLRAAWSRLGEITGETANEDVIREIFARFCIGK